MKLHYEYHPLVSHRKTNLANIVYYLVILFLITGFVYNCYQGYNMYQGKKNYPEQTMDVQYISSGIFNDKIMILTIRPDRPNQYYTYYAGIDEYLLFKNCKKGDIITIKNPQLDEKFTTELFFIGLNLFLILLYVIFNILLILVYDIPLQRKIDNNQDNNN